MRKTIKIIGLVLIIVSLLLLVVSCTPAQKNEVSDAQLKAEMGKLPPEKLNQIVAQKEQADQNPIAGQAYANKGLAIGQYQVPLERAAAIAKLLLAEKNAATEAKPTVAEQPAVKTPTTPPPSLKVGECLKITLLPYSNNAVESRVDRKIVCESVSCKFGDPQTAPPFKSEDDTCFGDKMTGCPKVSFYAFEGSVFQAGRESLCKSVSGCVYKQGATASTDTCSKE